MPSAYVARRPSSPPVPLARKRESEALVPRAFRSARRNRHLSVPLAVPPVMWTAGEVAHAFASAPVLAGLGTAGAVSAAAVALLAPHKWDRPLERWYAILSAVAAGTYVPVAAALGASSGLSGEILGGVLVAEGIAWGVPWYRHKRPRGRRKRERTLARWEAWWQGHCYEWNLGGSRVIEVAEHKVTIRIRVQLMPGLQSAQHVTTAVHLIESALQGMVEVGRVRVEVVKGNPSQVDLFFKRENPLGQVVEYDPALAPRSVHDDGVQGLSETGQWKHAPMRINSFKIGETRSGKSNDLLLQVMQLSYCPDARAVLIDLKGGRSARPMLEACAVDYVITDVDEARMYLRMVVAEIQARAKYAYSGEEQLHATPEVPALFTFADEVNPLASVASGDSECARLLGLIASQGSGLECYLHVYTQYGSLEESVRTEQTRGNLALRGCYRVAEARHGAFAIPEYNKLDASKLEERGTMYFKLGPKTLAEQVRAPKVSHDLFRSVTAANARALEGRPSFQLYAGQQAAAAEMTWQEWWDTRWLRLDPAFREISPQYQEAAERLAPPVQDVPQQAGPVLTGTAPPVTRVTIAPSPSAPGEGDGASVAARIEAETAEVPDGFRPSRRVVSKVGAALAEQKETFADALSSATSGISPDQLCAESGMGRTWAYSMLKALLEAGAVTRAKRGLYAPVPGISIHQAIQAIEDGNELLLRQAVRQVKRRVS